MTLRTPLTLVGSFKIAIRLGVTLTDAWKFHAAVAVVLIWVPRMGSPVDGWVTPLAVTPVAENVIPVLIGGVTTGVPVLAAVPASATHPLLAVE